MLYTSSVMKNKILFSVVLTGFCLALTACRKHAETPVESAQRQIYSTPPLENKYQPEQTSALVGDWRGTLQVQQAKLRVVLHIVKQGDGSLSVTMDSPDQGAKDIPANAVQFTPPNVTIQWQGIGGIFEGVLGDGKLSGTLQQGGVTVPLVFERG